MIPFPPPEGVTPTPVESDDGAAPTVATAARGEGAVQQQQQQQQQRPGRHPERTAGGERPARRLAQRDQVAVQAAPTSASKVVIIATRVPCGGHPSLLRVGRSTFFLLEGPT